VRPQAKSDTLKLASVGILFLVIGAAVVYAPQIVGAITGSTRRKGRPTKKGPRETEEKKPAKPGPAPIAASAEREAPTVTLGREAVQVTDVPPAPRYEPVRPSTPASAGDVITQLQQEVRSAWTRTR
jgi:hypothetical protein